MTRCDVPTGLPNTRAFEAAITRRLAYGRPFALLVADTDALKDFNRSYLRSVPEPVDQAAG